MSSCPEKSLQEGIYSHLLMDTGLQALLGSQVRLYDEITTQVQYPFVLFDRHLSRELDADDNALTGHELSLHVWSKYKGKAQTFDIVHALREAMQTMPSTLPDTNGDHLLVNLRVSFADTFRARDGRSFQSILRLKALTQAIS